MQDYQYKDFSALLPMYETVSENSHVSAIKVERIVMEHATFMAF
jgi:hypothetical protein